MPRDAASWALVRPRAVFEHPRLGRALGRAFDDAGERALLERARRVGYDVRTVERALVAWSGPTTLSAGLGPFDTRRIESLLWERMLPPRRRFERDDVIRVEGVVGATPATLSVWNGCALVLYAEGPGGAPTLAVERALRTSRENAGGDEPLALWHGRTVPAELRGRAPEALLEGVRDVEARADVTERGVALMLSLEGSLPPDAAARARRAIDAWAAEPLGESIGAAQWARRDRVSISARDGALEVRAEVPWAALDALTDVMGGRVGEGP